MPQRNYDTSTGLPYTRVDKLEIEYLQGAAQVRLHESTSVVLSGKVLKLADGDNVFAVHVPINNQTATAPIPLVDPATGMPPGGHTTLADAVMILTAICRQQQLLRDARGD
jgi:hypothetical protein